MRDCKQMGEKCTKDRKSIPPEFQHPEFQYRFKIVNASDINAFALPGGPMFVNRGMIEAAKNEGEMAGVMAHELSHVALRHSTAQQTKANNPWNQILAGGGYVSTSLTAPTTNAILPTTGAVWSVRHHISYDAVSAKQTASITTFVYGICVGF